MTITYRETPSLETGYLLELDKGWFGAVVPTAKTNLFTNPTYTNYPTSFPEATNGLLVNEGVHSPFGIHIFLSAWTATIGTVSGLYTFSVYLRSDTNGTATLRLGPTIEKVVNITSEYTRVFITADLGTNTTTQYASIRTDNPEFELTSVQIEEGRLTTFFSGDTEPNYYEDEDSFGWSGVPYNSTSFRKESAFSGGEVVSFQECGFSITEIEGLGYTDLTPTTYEQALSNSVLYSCSAIEHREIEISGIIQSCSHKDLMCSLGCLGELLYHTDRPTRLHFTPYEHCSDSVQCIMFDFLYTTGLNESVETLYGQELTIEGQTLDPCLYSCEEFSFVTVEAEDYIETGTNASTFFITDDDELETIEMPAFTPGFDFSTITQSIECNGVVYALVEQSIGIAGRETHLVSYNGATWDVHATVTATASAIDMTATNTGMICDLECTTDAVNGSTVWIGGQWSTANIASAAGVTDTGTVARKSLARYSPRDSTLRHYNVQHTGFVSDTGRINALSSFNNQIIVAGAFTSIGDGTSNFPLLNAAHIYTTDDTVRNYSFPNLTAFVGQGTRYGAEPVGPGISAKYIATIPSIFEVYVVGVNVFLVGDGSLDFATPVTLEPTQAYIFHYELDPSTAQYFERKSSFPFSADLAPNNDTGYVFDIIQWGAKDNYLVTGLFTQATSDLNGAAYDEDSNYLSNLAWLDSRGYNSQFDTPGEGRFDFGNAAGREQDYVYGIYDNDVSYAGTARPADDRTYAKMIDMGDRILLYGNIEGYGRSDDKTPACGFVEYIPRSQTNLSAGGFVPSVYEIGPTTPVVSLYNCWANAFTYDNVNGIKMLVSSAKSSTGDTTMYYNSGIQIDTCTNNNGETTAEITINTDNGVTGFAGIVNVTTNQGIYIDPVDLAAGATLRASIYDDRYLTLTALDGSTTQYNAPLLTTGNPFEVNHGDVIRVIFALSDTIDSSNPTFTAKYKNCYSSYAELVKCSDCE